MNTYNHTIVKNSPHHSLFLILGCLISSVFLCTPSVIAQDSKIDIENASTTPEVFAPNVISTPMKERDLAISPDGTQIFYTLNTSDNKTRAIIQYKRSDSSDDNAWDSPVVASFSGQYNDIEPFISPDGQNLYFASTRPMFEGDTIDDYNIWMVSKTDTEWGIPKAVPAPINTSTDEFYPSVAANGNLYFTACYDDCKGIEDIYVSKLINGKYQTPTSLDSNINTNTYEFNAFISPDESYLIFGSFGREDGFGGGDLYISHRDSNGNWSKAKNMGPNINSDKLDYCPFVDTNRGIFYFTSERAAQKSSGKLTYQELKELANGILNGSGNIYHVNWENEE